MEAIIKNAQAGNLSEVCEIIAVVSNKPGVLGLARRKQ